MLRTKLVTGILMSCLLGATPLAAQSDALPASDLPSPSLAVAASTSNPTPITLDDAAATAVIGALRMQFEDREVELKLDNVVSTRASLRDVMLDGAGQIRIEGSHAWLPIRFQALYDTTTGIVLSPSITLDRKPMTASVATPTDGLDRAVVALLAAEFASQEVGFELVSARVTGGGNRYAVVDGNGIATFAGEGESELQLQAVYDRANDHWVRVDYRLGGAAQLGQAQIGQPILAAR